MKYCKIQARQILTSSGWLSLQPKKFQNEIIERGIVKHYTPGEYVYRLGDDIGGIYGMISGAVGITTAPMVASPKLVHMGRPGGWTGEGCYLTRQPRQIELRCILETWLFHVPLHVLDQMTAKEPNVIRYISHILLLNSAMLVQVVHDLQKPEADKRIASVLHRSTHQGSAPVPLTQAEIGAMANASRKQVNATLQKFAALGWVNNSYRNVVVVAPKELEHFGRQPI